MTSPLSSMSGLAAATGATTPAAPAKTPGKELDKDAFLKLLVAQLKYQDPSKPADSSQFLAQTAQFTQLEKLSTLAKNQEDMLAAQLMLGASNLVGRSVTFTGLDGKEASGLVTSATVVGSNPSLRIGNADIPLSSVKEVRNASTS
jgi:flagellar basal-body rod modification protein FlgD